MKIIFQSDRKNGRNIPSFNPVIPNSINELKELKFSEETLKILGYSFSPLLCEKKTINKDYFCHELFDFLLNSSCFCIGFFFSRYHARRKIKGNEFLRCSFDTETIMSAL